MSKIVVTADSVIDLSPELINKYDIKICPLIIILGNESYLDGVTVTPDDIYAYVQRTGQLPKTAAESPSDYSDFFKPLVDQGYEVIHINIGSGFSSCHQNALLAAEETGGVHPIDSRNLSTGAGLVAIEAAEKVQAGWSAKEICDYLSEFVHKVDASFILDKLEFLYKGGRCSALAALGANLLNLKPCIEVRNGRMDVGKKYRGKLSNVLLQYTCDRLTNAQVRPSRIFITHSGMADETIIENVKQTVMSLNMFDEILITRAGCSVSSHCGPNTLGVLFVRS